MAFDLSRLQNEQPFEIQVNQTAALIPPPAATVKVLPDYAVDWFNQFADEWTDRGNLIPRYILDTAKSRDIDTSAHEYSSAYGITHATAKAVISLYKHITS